MAHGCLLGRQVASIPWLTPLLACIRTLPLRDRLPNVWGRRDPGLVSAYEGLDPGVLARNVFGPPEDVGTRSTTKVLGLLQELEEVELPPPPA